MDQLRADLALLQGQMKSNSAHMDERLDVMVERSDLMTRRLEDLSAQTQAQTEALREVRPYMDGAASVMARSFELVGEALRSCDMRFEEIDRRLRLLEQKLAS